ncbi:MAG TPA: acylphosphatase [Gemmataceae bacterium]|jgi:acylphosphatase|nr:acylphosphatase [Gemmataceae bacterium]
MLVCKRVYYSGHVQGVGFRYTAQALAKNFAVSGYVRNLRDGRVELVAEGEPGEVDAFLTAVADRMGPYIDHTRVEEIEPGGHQGFRIRY